MASFIAANKITREHEGGYSDDPDDPGGETLYGISRVYWPGWEGWRIVDQIKANGDGVAGIEADGDLPHHADMFYKEHFWDRFGGDQISSQPIANEIYDTGVNLSVSRAIEFLQEALNLTNRNGDMWADIVVDGLCGPGTRGKLEAALVRAQEQMVLKVMNHLQGGYYIMRMRESPRMEKYIGWFNRT